MGARIAELVLVVGTKLIVWYFERNRVDNVMRESYLNFLKAMQKRNLGSVKLNLSEKDQLAELRSKKK